MDAVGEELYGSSAVYGCHAGSHLDRMLLGRTRAQVHREGDVGIHVFGVDEVR